MTARNLVVVEDVGVRSDRLTDYLSALRQSSRVTITSLAEGTCWGYNQQHDLLESGQYRLNIYINPLRKGSFSFSIDAATPSPLYVVIRNRLFHPLSCQLFQDDRSFISYATGSQLRFPSDYFDR